MKKRPILFPICFVLSLCLTSFSLLVLSPGQAQAEEDTVIELEPGKSSETYHRPEDADYFWWDADSKVTVEITFHDGEKEIASSEKSFSKKIVSVKFLNPTQEKQKITLKTGF